MSEKQRAARKAEEKIIPVKVRVEHGAMFLRVEVGTGELGGKKVEVSLINGTTPCVQFGEVTVVFPIESLVRAAGEILDPQEGGRK
jgi:hypothetical protein